jgi:Flp pilus assembly protein TadD
MSIAPAPPRTGKDAAPGAVGATVTQPFEIDLHSEYLRADLLFAMGQPVQAARILEPVVEAEPANEAALELLARSYFGSAQLGKAEESLTRLVELAPANGWARRALARTLERQSRADEAVSHHRMADALGAE